MLEQDRKSEELQSGATMPAPTTDETPSTTTFTNQGALPPVSTASTTDASASTTPTASDQAFGAAKPKHSKNPFKKIGQGLEVAGGEILGVTELAGLRYPVKPYEAQVDAGLYRGSRLDDDRMAALKEMGIKGVVNLCMENNSDAGRAAKLGLQALHVPLLDNSSPTIAQMTEFIAFAQANSPAYVHCEAGKGRTGTAVACYRIAVDGWTADAAIAEGRTFGLQLINQIAFIRKFARSLNQPGGDTADVPRATSAATTADAAPVAVRETE